MLGIELIPLQWLCCCSWILNPLHHSGNSFFFFLTAPAAWGSSWARDGTRAKVQPALQLHQYQSLNCCTKRELPRPDMLFFFFKRPHTWHMVVPRLGVTLALQLLTYNTAIAMPDLNHVCYLHHSSWQCQILNPLNEARDQTHISMDTSWVYNLLRHHGNSSQLCF